LTAYDEWPIIGQASQQKTQRNSSGISTISRACTYSWHIIGANSEPLVIEGIAKRPEVSHSMTAATGFKPNMKMMSDFYRVTKTNTHMRTLIAGLKKDIIFRKIGYFVIDGQKWAGTFILMYPLILHILVLKIIAAVIFQPLYKID
jgi:hypothetical protein